MSVVIKTIGHTITPAVRLKSRTKSSKSWIFAGGMPKIDSAEKIFMPIISATMAFVMKIEQRIMNKVALLSSKSLICAKDYLFRTSDKNKEKECIYQNIDNPIESKTFLFRVIRFLVIIFKIQNH